MAKSITDLCTPENIIYEDFYSKTYRSTLTLHGVKKEWDIHNVSIPFSAEKEAALKARFHIEDVEEFYKVFAKCITNHLRIGQKLFRTQPNDEIHKYILVPEYCNIASDPQTKVNNIYWITECAQPVSNHSCWEPENRREFMVQMAPSLAEGITILHKNNIYIGAIDSDAVYIVKDEEGTECVKIGAFLYGYNENKTVDIAVPPATMPYSVQKSVRKGNDKPSETTDAAMLINFIRGSLKNTSMPHESGSNAEEIPSLEWYKETLECARNSEHPMSEVKQLLIEVRDQWGDIPDGADEDISIDEETIVDSTQAYDESDTSLTVPATSENKKEAKEEIMVNEKKLNKEKTSSASKIVNLDSKKFILPVLIVIVAVAGILSLRLGDKKTEAPVQEVDKSMIQAWAGDYVIDTNDIDGQVSICTNKNGVYYANADLKVKGLNYKGILTVSVDDSNELVLTQYEYQEGNQIAQYENGDAVVKMIKTDDGALHTYFNGTWSNNFHVKGEEAENKQQPADAAQAPTEKPQEAKPAETQNAVTKTDTAKDTAKADATKQATEKTEANDTSKTAEAKKEAAKTDSAATTQKAANTKTAAPKKVN